MYTHYSGSKLYLHRDIKRSTRHTSAISRSGGEKTYKPFR